jgi:hypothetical protein
MLVLYNQKTRVEELGIWKDFSLCRYPFLGALQTRLDLYNSELALASSLVLL